MYADFTERKILHRHRIAIKKAFELTFSWSQYLLSTRYSDVSMKGAINVSNASSNLPS